MLTVVGFSGSDSATRRRPRRPKSARFLLSLHQPGDAAAREERPGWNCRPEESCPKCRGMVWKSCDTRMRSSAAASASTSGSGTPSWSASLADRKSISGSRRKHPATIPSLRSASARKRIIRQDRRASSCCRARSSFCLRSGGAGWVLANSSSTRSRSAISVSTSSLAPR